MTCLLLRTSALRSAHRPALLEAFPAKHRPPLCGTEGNCGFLPALRAVGLRFRAHRRGMTTAALGALGLASLAALRFVFEALVVKKNLFAGAKNEFFPNPPPLHALTVEF